MACDKLLTLLFSTKQEFIGIFANSCRLSDAAACVKTSWRACMRQSAWWRVTCAFGTVPRFSHTLNQTIKTTKAGARVKELQRIDAENQRLLKRLQSEPQWSCNSKGEHVEGVDLPESHFQLSNLYNKLDHNCIMRTCFFHVSLFSQECCPACHWEVCTDGSVLVISVGPFSRQVQRPRWTCPSLIKTIRRCLWGEMAWGGAMYWVQE